MTWHKEDLRCKRVVSLSVATLVPMATLMHRKSRLGNFPWIGIPWRVLQALSSPRPDGRQTDDMLPKIISLDSSGSEEGIGQLRRQLVGG